MWFTQSSITPSLTILQLGEGPELATMEMHRGYYT
jgi:hypothetical protein